MNNGNKAFRVLVCIALVLAVVGLFMPRDPGEPLSPFAYQTDVYLTSGGDKLVIASGGEIETQSGSTADYQDGATYTLPAADYVRLDGDTTNQTQTAGTFDVNVGTVTDGVSAVNVALTQDNGTTSGEDTWGQIITLTGNDADGDVFGLKIEGAATANAAAGTYEYLASLVCSENTAGACPDALLITAGATDTAVTDGVDVSDSEIVNAVNIGVNPILGSNADTLFLGLTDHNLTLTGNEDADLTFAGADNTGPADTIFDTTGAGTVQLGSGDVTSALVRGVAIDADMTGGISLDADLASNFSAAAGDILIDAETGSVNIIGSEADANAIHLDANDTVTSGINIDTGTVSGMTIDGGPFSVDGTGAFNVNTAAGDITVEAETGSVTIKGDEGAGDAVHLDADQTALGGVTIAANTGGVDVNLTATGPFAIDGDMLIVGNDGADGDVADADNDALIVGVLEVDGEIECDGTLDVDSTSNFSDTATFARAAGDAISVTAGGALHNDGTLNQDGTSDFGAAVTCSFAGNCLTSGATADIEWLGFAAFGDGTPDGVTDGTAEAVFIEGGLEVNGTLYADGAIDADAGVSVAGGALDVDDAVDVDGSSDEIQLAVTGYTTQTTDLAFFDGGLVDIGGGTYATANGDNDLGIEGDLEVNGSADIDTDLDVDGTANLDAVDIDGDLNFRDVITFTVSLADFGGIAIDLDADGDTSITADTDDVIDFEIGGADDFQMAANAFVIRAGSKISVENATDVGAVFQTKVSATYAVTGTAQTGGVIPANADVVDWYIVIYTAFDGSGADTMVCGTAGDTDKWVDDLDVAAAGRHQAGDANDMQQDEWATSFGDVGASNVTLQCVYTDANNDAAAGAVTFVVFYRLD